MILISNNRIYVFKQLCLCGIAPGITLVTSLKAHSKPGVQTVDPLHHCITLFQHLYLHQETKVSTMRKYTN